MILKSIKRNRQHGGMIRSSTSTIKRSNGLNRNIRLNAINECNKLSNIFRQIKDSYTKFEELDKKVSKEAKRYMRQYHSILSTEHLSSMTTLSPKPRTKKKILKSDVLYHSVKDFINMGKAYKVNMNMLHALCLRLRCYIMRYLFVNTDNTNDSLFKEYSSIFDELKKLFKQSLIDISIIKNEYNTKKNLVKMILNLSS